MVWVPHLSPARIWMSGVTCIPLSFSVIFKGCCMQCLYHLSLQNCSFPCTTRLTRSTMHKKKEKCFDAVHTLVCSFCCVVAVRGTSPEGGGGSWSTALQSLANMWINGVGSQGNWEIYVFTVNKDVFFHILTIHSLLKLMLPVCFIQKGSLLFIFFYPDH